MSDRLLSRMLLLLIIAVSLFSVFLLVRVGLEIWYVLSYGNHINAMYDRLGPIALIISAAVCIPVLYLFRHNIRSMWKSR